MVNDQFTPDELRILRDLASNACYARSRERRDVTALPYGVSDFDAIRVIERLDALLARESV